MVNNRNIIIEDFNIKEALRYLGYGANEPDQKTRELLLECENELREVIKPIFTYKVFDYKDGKIQNSTYQLEGESIKNHLANCEKVILMCATLSSGVDNLIRKRQIGNMAKAVMIDSMASAIIEQVCDRAEEIMLAEFTDYEHTWRFGLGYGDFPLSGQKKFLELLDAPKRVGVCVNDGMMLTPTKSVTCVIGLGHNLKVSSVRSCDFCDFRDKCQFRKDGTNCGK